jgi:two-component system CheB/CheR fusion protein
VINSKNKVIAKDEQIANLKKQLVYYREITETIRSPFIILSEDLYVVSANQAFYRKFKVTKKVTEGKLVYELGDNQWDAPELRELLERILPKSRILSDYEIKHDFPHIGHRTMLLNARQVDSKQLILLSFEDVTMEKKLKRDSEKMTGNLIKQRDKLQWVNDAKDEFISLASHQLRTPATVVKQYVGMLKLGYAGKMSQEQTLMLDVAYASNERQLEIIEDLLRIAKVDAGKVYLHRTSYDAVRQVESVIHEQDVLFKDRQQSVLFRKPHENVKVFNDEKLMLMVLENILDNAGKYSKIGGLVTVGINQDEKFTKISFKDNGVGISQKDRQKLFKKFVRIDNPNTNAVKGTGLGLYWAKKVVDLHNGSIEVISKINEGSTFTIKTPNHVDNSSAQVLTVL